MEGISFRKQLEEDIQEYKEKYPFVPNIQKPEWAFNFWVLDKLYSEDDQIIVDHIVDYNDKGIDCFVWHESQLDLYLIQNKYYSDDTKIDLDYVQNTFLTRALSTLENGSYYRSPELQDIYTKYKNVPGFNVSLVLYITNDTWRTEPILKAIETFNKEHRYMNAAIYGLKEIENLYYQEPKAAKKTMTYVLQTTNKGTQLSVKNDDYKLNLSIDSQFIMTPVYNLYQMYNKALKEEYPIFDSNIREYLGSAGSVNKRIRETLKDAKDRANFFYYNNGITIIAKSVKDQGYNGKFRLYEIKDPQIVNGCQTVSTIGEVFSGWPVDTVEDDFKNTYVMLKILVIPDKTPEMNDLRKNIVTFNNSQNAIDQKTFEANSDQ